MAHPPLAPYEAYYAGERNGINTLFVSGLPDDVKAREIHNLFRRRPGFDSCQLKYTGRGNQVVAFATFFNHQSAVAALHALNGVKFDPQTGSALHIELARSNSRRKRKPGAGAYVVIDNRKKEDHNNAQESSSNDGNYTQETSSNDAHSGESESDEPSDAENDDSETKEEDSGTLKSAEAVMNSENAVAAANQPEKNIEGNQCSTLFIANLGPNCSEDELKQVLSQYSGFNVLKLRARGGMPVAFADFEDIEQANKAMEGLAGTTLPSSDRGGMHIEYARSKMRKS